MLLEEQEQKGRKVVDDSLYDIACKAGPDGCIILVFNSHFLRIEMVFYHTIGILSSGNFRKTKKLYETFGKSVVFSL